MTHQKLLTLFHKDESKWNEEYASLFNAPTTRHIDIQIRQYQSTHTFPAFFYYTEEITHILSDITRELVNLTQITCKLPQIALRHFTKSCLIEEIQSSNDIEGVRSTRKEIKTAIYDQSNAENRKRTRLWSIVNKYMRLQNEEDIPFNTSQDLRNFYDSFVLDEVCREDPTNAPNGKIFRKDMVEVNSKSKVIHQGIYPESKIIEFMNIALSILQDKSIPELIRISIYHYLFGYIHPFYDGNGRTSRFITSYYLSRTLNPLVAYRLSITIKKSIRTYYKLFEDTNSYGNRGDLTPFITGFLWLILKSIARTNEILSEKGSTLKELDGKLKKLKLDKTNHGIYYILLQAALFSDEGASLEEIGSVINKHPMTVRKHLNRFPAEHIIVNTAHRAYLYQLNISILQNVT